LSFATSCAVSCAAVLKWIWFECSKSLDRIERSEPMSGIFVIHQKGSALSTIIEDLLLLDECSSTDEWSDQILYLPLR
jgi:hypothetical protein